MPRRTISLRALSAALVVVAAIVGPSCAAPTLPLPPPTALVEAPAADGTARVTGNAVLGAFVGCLNDNSEQGVIVRADPDTGDYELRIPAVSGDDLTLWQFNSTAPGGLQEHRTVP